MKKLNKVYMKYYILLAIVILMQCIYIILEEVKYYYVGTFDGYSDVDITEILWNCNHFLFIASGMFRMLVVILINMAVAKCLFHTIRIGQMKREFLETLPVTRKELRQYINIMDGLTMSIPMVFCGWIYYIVCICKVKDYYDYVPWIGKSLIGATIIGIAFIWMIVGFNAMMEELFPNGVVKTVASVGSVLAILIVFSVGVQFIENPIFQRTAGFFTLHPAQEYRQVEGQESTDLKWQYTDDTIRDDMKNGLAKLAKTDTRYQELMERYDVDGIIKDMNFESEGMKALSKPGVVAIYSILYLILGLVGCFLSENMAQKRMVEKRVIYYQAGSWYVGALLGIALFIVCYNMASVPWNVLLETVAAFILFMTVGYRLKAE